MTALNKGTVLHLIPSRQYPWLLTLWRRHASTNTHYTTSHSNVNKSTFSSYYDIETQYKETNNAILLVNVRRATCLSSKQTIKRVDKVIAIIARIMWKLADTAFYYYRQKNIAIY